MLKQYEKKIYKIGKIIRYSIYIGVVLSLASSSPLSSLFEWNFELSIWRLCFSLSENIVLSNWLLLVVEWNRISCEEKKKFQLVPTQDVIIRIFF